MIEDDETKIIIARIDSAVFTIKKRFLINTFIFGTTLIVVIIILWRLIAVSIAFDKTALIVSSDSQSIAKVKANQDLYRDQYLTYIKDMIVAMNKLQEDNPKLNVPKAPVLRILPNDKVTESELRRLPQPGPTPSPIVKTKTIVKIKRAKTPTPKPFKDWFK